MSRLHQIQVQFDPRQDRGLLRIRTSAAEEYQFWLTRRFVRLLWKLLVKVVELDTRVSTQSSPAAKQAVLAFQHEQAVKDSDFDTRYQGDNTNRPLGDEPLLLAKAQLKRADGKRKVLALAPAKGPAVELALDDKLVHSMCKLLQDVTRTADWNLDLEFETLPLAASATGQRPRLN